MAKDSPASKQDTGSDIGRPQKAGLERLIFFNDAVFAIAITILALDIRLPANEAAQNDAELARILGGMWHSYLAYFISFMVIGTFWMGHHRKFQLIKRYE